MESRNLSRARLETATTGGDDENLSRARLETATTGGDDENLSCVRLETALTSGDDDICVCPDVSWYHSLISALMSLRSRSIAGLLRLS